ncbi:haloacid dehalogenase type II [Asanoa sp. NPDC049573]|uniref:haloacid dehalogenase type II n=1 Tax=Asanoa sp. NPDC049573 TaxID=3155396 RepID=UPI003419F4BD
MATQVIAFDVNETLLDLSVLDRPFEETLGSAALRRQWFAQMLQLAFIGGLTGRYVDFASAQRDAYLMVAAAAGVPATADDAAAMAERMRTLPAHPEVRDALARLRRSPLTIVALGNSALDVIEEQLSGAELRTHFDAVYSADTVNALKPAARPYRFVAEQCGVGIGEVRLVAAHHWDISGALAAGCRAAFVRRPGMVLRPSGDRPDIEGADLGEVVDAILRIDVTERSDH